jgi:epoxide hydrolase-like predicted phosphatase
MINAVIFDVGGVLHSSENEYVYQDIIQTLEITRDQFQEAMKTLSPLFSTGKISEADLWTKFFDITKAPLPLPEGESLWAREFRKRYRVFDDVLNVVDQLKQLGYQVAVLSNSIEPHTAVNREMGVYDPFPLVVLSQDVGFIKPDPEIYLYTLKKLGVKPEESVFIDDLEENVVAARNLGMKGIVFQNCKQMIQELKLLGISL